MNKTNIISPQINEKVLSLANNLVKKCKKIYLSRNFYDFEVSK